MSRRTEAWSHVTSCLTFPQSSLLRKERSARGDGKEERGRDLPFVSPLSSFKSPLALLSFLKRDNWGRVRLHACSATSCLFVSILRCNWKPKNKAMWLKKAKTQVSCVPVSPKNVLRNKNKLNRDSGEKLGKRKSNFLVLNDLKICFTNEDVHLSRSVF